MNCSGCNLKIIDEDVMKCPRCGADLGRDRRDVRAAHIPAREESEPLRMNRCQECGGKMIPADGCSHCPMCGFGYCG